MTNVPIESSSLTQELQARYDRLGRASFAEQLWSTQLDIWSDDAGTRARIGNRLGWLHALDFVEPLVPRLRACADAVRRDGFTHVVLLGMGGSSLAPEVLRQILSPRGHVPAFHMLDSVDPDAVRAAMAHAETSLFIIASKSGSTIEPNTMMAEARRRVVAAGHADWGTRFIAITDNGTDLHDRATKSGFRDIFVNPSDIGGRYSALSLFGMLPAALMGIDVGAMLASARAMASACRTPNAEENPGLALGALMAAGQASRRDKLTLLVPARLASFGLWVEQLVAESTGKQKKGVVPIAGESTAMVAGQDRVIVSISVAGETPDSAVLDKARASGAPMAEIQIPDLHALGGEFLRWEVATATAGWLMDINPFDEPDVGAAKEATKKKLEVHQQRKQLPFPEAHAQVSSARLTLSEAALTALDGAQAASFLNVIKTGDYFALLAFLPPEDARFEAVLQEFRMMAAVRASCATMFGYGPRYLHSTGQLHKGGANNGVFLIVTAEAAEDLAIPDEPYSFSVLEMAQALGDFTTLDDRGRRAMFLRLPRRDPELLRRVLASLLEA